jgi:hypothetical protein
MTVMKVFRWVVIAIVVGLLLFAAYRVVSSQISASPSQPVVGFAKLMPSSWQVMGGPKYFLQCDLDGDPANGMEYVVLYRYDKTDQQPGFIGGVVFGSSVNRVPQSPSTLSPSRPAVLIPYRLLPDIYSNAGQGYLGETDVSVKFWPPAVPNQGCMAQEMTVLGYGPSATIPTGVSIFRWDPANRRYSGSSYAGDARVVAAGTSSDANYVKQVTTYNRFNDRSGLCKVQQYQRPDPGGIAPSVEFTETVSGFTIDFCYGAPKDPAYPEGVVMNVLRSPKTLPAADSSATGASYLTQRALDAVKELPQPLQVLADAERSPIRVISLTNPGVLDNTIQEGTSGVGPEDQTQGTWWWSPERVTIRTAVVLENGAQYDVTWRLASVADQSVAADAHWRIVALSSP